MSMKTMCWASWLCYLMILIMNDINHDGVSLGSTKSWCVFGACMLRQWEPLFEASIEGDIFGIESCKVRVGWKTWPGESHRVAQTSGVRKAEAGAEVKKNEGNHRTSIVGSLLYESCFLRFEILWQVYEWGWPGFFSAEKQLSAPFFSSAGRMVGPKYKVIGLVCKEIALYIQ